MKIQRCHTERISDPTTFSVFMQFAFHVQWGCISLESCVFIVLLLLLLLTRKSQSSVGILQARLLHVKPSCSAIWNILWEDKRLLRPEKKTEIVPHGSSKFSVIFRESALEYRRRLAAETTPLPAPLSSVRGLCALGPCQTWERQATLREATFLKAVRKNNIGQGWQSLPGAWHLKLGEVLFCAPFSPGSSGSILSLSENTSVHAALASAAVIQCRQFRRGFESSG